VNAAPVFFVLCGLKIPTALGILSWVTPPSTYRAKCYMTLVIRWVPVLSKVARRRFLVFTILEGGLLYRTISETPCKW
jgi:hypothetical protein